MKIQISSIILFFTLVLIPFNTAAQLDAIINSPDSLIGCEGLMTSLTFNDQSDGTVQSRIWTLDGDTILLTESTITRSFPDAGSYTLRLEVNNNSITDFDEIEILVHPKPTMSFTNTSKTKICSGSSVSFSANGSSNAGIANWAWDFGDGTTSNNQNPDHIFNYHPANGGIFDINLEVTDGNGCKLFENKDDYVKASPGASVNLSSNNNIGCFAPANIAITATTIGWGDNTNPFEFTWNITDDETIEMNQGINHTINLNYDSLGTYDLRLTIIDSIGCETDTLFRNYINLVTVDAEFSVDSFLCLDEMDSFINHSTPGAYLWNFGNDDTSTADTPSYSYTNGGTFEVILEVEGGAGCLDYDTAIITVNHIELDFTTDSLIACSVPFDITLSPTADSSNSTLSYAWQAVHSTTNNSTTVDSNSNGNLSLLSEGKYDIIGIIRDTFGCADTVIKEDYISIDFPNVAFSYTYENYCTPIIANFVSGASDPNGITSYLWTFEDGETSTDSSDSHTFVDEDIYNVTLQVTNSLGCIGTLSTDIPVGNKPAANFNFIEDSICASDTIFLLNNTTGGDSGYIWDGRKDSVVYNILSDSPYGILPGGCYSKINQSDTFMFFKGDTGWVKIQMIANHFGCLDTIEKDYYVRGPIANFDVTMNCDSHLYVQYNDTSIHADNWHWHFGTGSPEGFSADTSINYNTVQRGEDKRVLLTVSNITDGYGCQDTISQLVRLRIPRAEITTPDTFCAPANITFTTASSQDPYTYIWHFGEGDTTSPTINASATHQYSDPGNFSIYLQVIDQNNCTHDTTAAYAVSGIAARFFSDTLRNCLPLKTTLIDTSFSDSAILGRIWEYRIDYESDNEYDTDIIDSENDFNTLVPFDTLSNLNDSIIRTALTDTGLYTMRLTINTSNCSRTISKEEYIESIKPNATFYLNPNDYYTCNGDTVNFINLSTTSDNSNFISYWDFSYDSLAFNIEDSSSTPSYPFIGDEINFSDTTYKVVLVIKDTNNCKDTSIFHLNTDIEVHNPKANFRASQVLENDTFFCAPDRVEFENLTVSESATNYEWDLTYNDESGPTISITRDAGNYYYLPGEYNVRLIVNTVNGNCRDTITKTRQVRAQGAYAEIAYLGDNEICRGTDVVFRLINKTVNLNDVRWAPSDGNELTNDTTTTFVYTYHKARDYRPIAFITNTIVNDDDIVCVRAAEINEEYEDTITVQNVISNFLADTNQACIPGTISFINNSSLDDTYLWTIENEKNYTTASVTHTFRDSGSYLITQVVYSEIMCADTSIDSVRIHPLPMVGIEAGDSLCRGDSFLLTGIGRGTQLYWTPNIGLSDTNGLNTLASPDSSTSYVFHIIDSNNCYNYSDTAALVSVMQPLKTDWEAYISLIGDELHGQDIYDGGEIKVIVGEELHIGITDSSDLLTSITWSDENGDTLYLNTDTGNTVIITPRSVEVNSTYSKTYTATIQDFIKGDKVCFTNSETIEITVIDSATLAMPDVFTPNGDDKNDVVYPKGAGIKELIEFSIYNRWVELVYTSRNPEEGWDGTNLEGKPQNSDKYVYIIKGIYHSGNEEVKRGEIILVR